jgi:hypothetical protein
MESGQSALARGVVGVKHRRRVRWHDRAGAMAARVARTRLGRPESVCWSDLLFF